MEVPKFDFKALQEQNLDVKNLSDLLNEYRKCFTMNNPMLEHLIEV